MSVGRPPIALDRHFFTRLAVNANPEYKPDTPELEPENLDSHLHAAKLPDRPGAIVCTQTLKLAKAPMNPYSLDIECLGFFNKPDGSELSDEELGAAIELAHQTLYSAVREMVLTVTARMAWGPLSLGLAGIGEITRKAASKSADAKATNSTAAKTRRRKAPTAGS